jgi:alkylation response protein AidB-like acyl-CoA dehydrogenase
MILPRSRWDILDTWHAAGLRGTGSHDIALDGAMVPAEHSFDLFGGTPCLPGPDFAAPLLQFSLHIASVALGIAEGALGELIELAGTGKTRLYGRTPMAGGELFQYHLGHVEAELRAAEALLLRQVTEHQDLAAAGTLGPQHLPRVLQAVAWVVETATGAVDASHRAGGGSAVYERSPLQRRLRDIHTLSQHASVQQTVFADAGTALLALPQARQGFVSAGRRAGP